MPVTITWGQGPSAWTWSLPTTNMLGPVTADLLSPSALKGLVQVLEPLLPLAAEAVGASVPGVVLLLVATRATQHLLTSAAASVPDSSITPTAA